MKQLLAIALLVLLATGCGLSGNVVKHGEEASPIKIGVVLSLTGYGSVYGQNSKQGLDLAAAQINAAGGVAGRPITLVYEDDKTEGKTAVSATQKLIAQDKVDAIIGGTWDLSLEPMVPVATEANILLINPSTGNNDGGRLSPILFRTFPPTAHQVASIKPILQREHVHTIALFRNSGTWAIGHKQALEHIMQEVDGKVVADFAASGIDGNDFRTEITKLKESKPDAVFLAVGEQDAAHIVTMMKEQGVQAIIFSADGALSNAIQDHVVTSELAQNAYCIIIKSLDTSFTSDFVKTYGKEPQVTAENAFQALHILVNSYRETGTTDTEANRVNLEKSHLFNANGDATPFVPVYKMVDGAFVLQ